ncbi:MAG TPA: glycosyltransferase family 4 protein [Gemmatimonadaceae bacterium]|nr:glycosyltransferase family 4 protein [Gemmatimonadaceae bacterium]
MRILIVNKFARVTGGADAYCLNLAASMRVRGHEVVFLATSDPANGDNGGAFVPATVTRDNRDMLGLRGQLLAASSAFWNHSAYDAMRRILAVFEPDVVSAHKLYPQLSVSPLVAAKRADVPVVQTAHDYEFVSASAIDHMGRRTDRDEVAWRFRALNSSLFAVKRGVHRRSVARWIAVSEFVAKRLQSRGIAARVVLNPAPSPRQRVVPFGDRKGIVFAGRLTKEKGIAHVVRLAELVPALDISMAGDGPAAPIVEEAQRRLSNLHYVGKIDRDATEGLIAGALAVVVPSLWQEPGALVTLEAMACGTPLVVYNVGGIAEYVAGARAGIVVEQHPELLAAACLSFIRDPVAWNLFSAAGISAASGVHSVDNHCAALEQVFAEVAAAGP